MPSTLKQILSVSRRTDIPAFYLPWFMTQMQNGTITVANPFNQQIRQVDITPQRIHTIMFWSKNFGPFLQQCYGERLQDQGYHLFFNFSINSASSVLEPGVPHLNQRLDQLRQLCRRFGADSVQWRFDPICHFTTRGGSNGSNLADFDIIAKTAGACGVTTCITSFMDHYRKIERRSNQQLTFHAPPMVQKVAIVLKLGRTLRPLGIKLSLCCEKDVLAALPEKSAIVPAACISGSRIMAVHGGRVSNRKDAGQRKAAGCGCTVSVDVGSYALHPCHHNCLFCYANPACDRSDHR